MKHLPLKAGGAQTALLAGPAQLLQGAPDSREPGGAPSGPVEVWGIRLSNYTPHRWQLCL